ncbi:MAG: DUF167 domain-containing protein [Candidatus Aenigmatarchaeota archaeon]
MEVRIRVVPNASKDEVIEEPDGSLKVRVAARAVEGKANRAVIEVLAKHFGIRKNKIEILRGEKGREKVVSVMG